MKKLSIFIKYAILALGIAILVLTVFNVLSVRSLEQIARVKEAEFESNSKLRGLEVSEELKEQYKKDIQAYKAMAEESKKNRLRFREFQGKAKKRK